MILLLRWIHVAQTSTGQAQSQSQVKGQIPKSQRPSRVLLFTAGAKYHKIYPCPWNSMKNREDLYMFPWCHDMARKLAFLCPKAPLLLCALSWSGQPRRRRQTILRQGIEVSVSVRIIFKFMIFMGVILHLPVNDEEEKGWEVCDDLQTLQRRLLLRDG